MHGCRSVQQLATLFSASGLSSKCHQLEPSVNQTCMLFDCGSTQREPKHAGGHANSTRKVCAKIQTENLLAVKRQQDFFVYFLLFENKNVSVNIWYVVLGAKSLLNHGLKRFKNLCILDFIFHLKSTPDLVFLVRDGGYFVQGFSGVLRLSSAGHLPSEDIIALIHSIYQQHRFFLLSAKANERCMIISQL